MKVGMRGMDVSGAVRAVAGALLFSATGAFAQIVSPYFIGEFFTCDPHQGAFERGENVFYDAIIPPAMMSSGGNVNSYGLTGGSLPAGLSLETFDLKTGEKAARISGTVDADADYGMYPFEVTVTGQYIPFEFGRPVRVTVRRWFTVSVLHNGAFPDYTLSGGKTNDSFTATRNNDGTVVGAANVSAQAAIDAIKADAAAGPCHITFDGTPANPLNIGSTPITFDGGSSGTDWLHILLHGSVTGTGSSTISCQNVDITSDANIANTAAAFGRTINFNSYRMLAITGGTVSSKNGFAISGGNSGSNNSNFNITISGTAMVTSDYAYTIWNYGSTYLYGGTVQSTRADGYAVYQAYSSSSIVLGNAPTIVGKIHTYVSRLIANTSSEIFNPGAKTYRVEWSTFNLNINSTAVIGGASFLSNFAVENEDYYLSPKVNNLILEAGNYDYSVTPGGTGFVAWKDGVLVANSASIQTVIYDIRTDAGGHACSITFGGGGSTLNIGTAEVEFVSAGGGTRWGPITLHGKITSAAAPSGRTVYATGAGVSITSDADITNTAGAGNYSMAIHWFASGTLNIVGGTVSAPNAGNRAINITTGTLNVFGGTVEGYTGINAYGINTREVNIFGGTVAGTVTAIMNNGAGVLNVYGGDIGTPSLYSSTAIYNMDSGTAPNIYQGEVNVYGGTVGGAADYGIFNRDSGAVNVYGGTVRTTTGYYAIFNQDTGSITVGGSAMVRGNPSSITYGTVYNRTNGVVNVLGGTVQSDAAVMNAVCNASDGVVNLGNAPTVSGRIQSRAGGVRVNTSRVDAFFASKNYTVTVTDTPIVSGTTVAVTDGAAFLGSFTPGNAGYNLKAGGADIVLSAPYTATLNPMVPGLAMLTVPAAYGYPLPTGMPAPGATPGAGYVFGGYFAAEDGQGAQYYSGAMAPMAAWDREGSEMIYAYWAHPGLCEARFNNGENASGGQTANILLEAGQPYGALAAAPPTRTGFIFAGYWDTADDDIAPGQIYYDVNLEPTRGVWDKADDIVYLYARWTAHESGQIYLNANGGVIQGRAYIPNGTYGEPLPKYPNMGRPLREGYIFTGYYQNPGAPAGAQYYTQSLNSGPDAWNQVLDPVSNPYLQIYAGWEPATSVYVTYYNLTAFGLKNFNPRGKTVYYHGHYGTLPDNALISSLNPGETFIGWFTTPGWTDGNLVRATSTVNNEYDHAIYAMVVDTPVVSVTLDVVTNGGQIGGSPNNPTMTFPVGYTYGLLGLYYPDVRLGYTFEGWFTEPTGGTLVTYSDPVPNANTTLYAQWTRIQPGGGLFEGFDAPPEVNDLGSVWLGQTVNIPVGGLDAGGAAITYQITTGHLPDGLFLDPPTGQIYGTVSQTENCGPFLFTVTAAPANGADPVKRIFRITVRDVITLVDHIYTGGTDIPIGSYHPYGTTPPQPNYPNYAVSITISGGVLGSGSMTLGGYLDEYGVIYLDNGMFLPVGEGFDISVTVQGTTKTGVIDILGASGGDPFGDFGPKTNDLGYAVQGQTVSIPLGGSGVNYTYALTDGILPDGLAVDPLTGELAGLVDPEAELGPYVFAVTATGSGGATETVHFRITVVDDLPSDVRITAIRVITATGRLEITAEGCTNPAKEYALFGHHEEISTRFDGGVASDNAEIVSAGRKPGVNDGVGRLVFDFPKPGHPRFFFHARQVE